MMRRPRRGLQEGLHRRRWSRRRWLREGLGRAGAVRCVCVVDVRDNAGDVVAASTAQCELNEVFGAEFDVLDVSQCLFHGFEPDEPGEPI